MLTKKDAQLKSFEKTLEQLQAHNSNWGIEAITNTIEYQANKLHREICRLDTLLKTKEAEYEYKVDFAAYLRTKQKGT